MVCICIRMLCFNMLAPLQSPLPHFYSSSATPPSRGTTGCSPPPYWVADVHMQMVIWALVCPPTTAHFYTGCLVKHVTAIFLTHPLLGSVYDTVAFIQLASRRPAQAFHTYCLQNGWVTSAYVGEPWFCMILMKKWKHVLKRLRRVAFVG